MTCYSSKVVSWECQGQIDIDENSLNQPPAPPGNTRGKMKEEWDMKVLQTLVYVWSLHVYC